MQYHGSLSNQLMRPLCLPLLLAVTACGSGSGGTPESSEAETAATVTPSLSEALADRNITQVGVIQYEKKAGTPNINDVRSNLGAQFYQYQAPLSAETVSELVAEYSTAESEYCKIWVYEPGDESLVRDQPHPITLESSKLVSAGEVLPVLSTEGTLFELHAWSPFMMGPVIAGSDVVGSVFYEHENKSLSNTLDDHLPNNSYVVIPGDSFPAIDDVEIPDVELVTDLSVLNTVPGDFNHDVLTADSVVTWTASSNGNEYAWLHGYASVTSSGQPERFYCHVRDDGEFRFPANTQAVFTEFEFPENEVRLWRDQFNFAVKDDALIVVKSTTRGNRGGDEYLFVGPTLWDW